MTAYLLNAFSLSMLPSTPVHLRVEPISLDEVRQLAEAAVSAVGHEEAARTFSVALGRPVPFARTTVALAPGDVALVGQYLGPRLPEGATSLPEGARIEWRRVSWG